MRFHRIRVVRCSLNDMKCSHVQIEVNDTILKNINLIPHLELFAQFRID